MVNDNIGKVIWFTGLSGSGKTTTAYKVKDKAKEIGYKFELLDGDDFRSSICKDLGFTYEDRLENVRRIVFVAELLSRNGIDVLVSVISPYKTMRDYARSKLKDYREVYVYCPLIECEKRDVKGLYKKARNNEIQSFTGISDVYEEPQSPDLIIDTLSESLEENSIKVLELLGFIKNAV